MKEIKDIQIKRNIYFNFNISDSFEIHDLGNILKNIKVYLENEKISRKRKYILERLAELINKYVESELITYQLPYHILPIVDDLRKVHLPQLYLNENSINTIGCGGKNENILPICKLEKNYTNTYEIKSTKNFEIFEFQNSYEHEVIRKCHILGKNKCISEKITYDEKTKTGVTDKIEKTQLRKNLETENIIGYTINNKLVNKRMDILDNIYSLDEIIFNTSHTYTSYKDTVENNLNFQLNESDFKKNSQRHYEKVKIREGDGYIFLYFKEDITHNESLELKKKC